MNDIYLYEDVPVLKNKFGIKDEKTLDLVEAEQSRASMMLLYEHGFHDFSNRGVKKIHRTLFEDVYKWAGNYRVINIIKREPGGSLEQLHYTKKFSHSQRFGSISRVPCIRTITSACAPTLKYT